MNRGTTRQVPSEHAGNALSKCAEFLEVARESLGARRWNAAGLNSVHAGIAAGDAVLIATAGVRSISADHGALIALLESKSSGHFAEAQRRQLTGLLKMKNQVAYEQRLLTEIEARQLVDHAARLHTWAAKVVASST